jgi:hypothetical protein
VSWRHPSRRVRSALCLDVSISYLLTLFSGNCVRVSCATAPLYTLLIPLARRSHLGRREHGLYLSSASLKAVLSVRSLRTTPARSHCTPCSRRSRRASPKPACARRTTTRPPRPRPRQRTPFSSSSRRHRRLRHPGSRRFWRSLLSAGSSLHLAHTSQRLRYTRLRYMRFSRCALRFEGGSVGRNIEYEPAQILDASAAYTPRAQAGLSFGWDIRAWTHIQAGGAICVLRRGHGRRIHATHRAPAFCCGIHSVAWCGISPCALVPRSSRPPSSPERRLGRCRARLLMMTTIPSPLCWRLTARMCAQMQGRAAGCSPDETRHRARRPHGSCKRSARCHPPHANLSLPNGASRRWSLRALPPAMPALGRTPAVCL